MVVDKGTFGGNGASVVLAKILTERNDPRITKKVGRIICQYDLYLNDLKLIRKLNSHNGLLRLAHEDFIGRTYILFDTEIGNFVRNVLCGKFKAYINK